MLRMRRVGQVSYNAGILFQANALCNDSHVGSRLPRNRSVPQQERLMKRNISKLFGEKMEIFGGKIEFSPASIVEGIIKIFLKSFAECVRMRTFGKFGYQQVGLCILFRAVGRLLIQPGFHFIRFRWMQPSWDGLCGTWWRIRSTLHHTFVSSSNHTVSVVSLDFLFLRLPSDFKI